MYENFSASSHESLDSISNRLQKIVSQLAILGENISQEDLNFKFLRSLPSEWSMHVVVWRNKPDLGTISFDDLYNNFKIVKQEDITASSHVNTASTNNSQDVEAKPAKRQRTEEVSESVQEQTKTDEEPKTDELILKTLNKLEVYSDDTMQFWKIIRVGNHTKVYQVFEDMLKNFERDDLVKLWSLVQERYNSSGLTEDKEIELWSQSHVTTEKGQDIFMLVEKDYPLTKGLATLMLYVKTKDRPVLSVQDYAIWEVIEYGNSFKPVARTTTNADGTSTSTIPDLGTISFDDLYNNFKIVEQEVKRSVTSSLNSNSQNVAFVSTPDSTNEDNTANVQDSTASTHVSFHEDLEQIHEDDLKEIDLKWQLALLSLKARKFYQRTGPRNQESRPRNQESMPRNQESSKRTVNVEGTSSKAIVVFDGAGVTTPNIR
ncbi:hypothetical protein Tco_0694896 [Tanacetum coccineum]